MAEGKTVEVQLPPIDPDKPASAAFNFNDFLTAKGGTIPFEKSGIKEAAKKEPDTVLPSDEQQSKLTDDKTLESEEKKGKELLDKDKKVTTEEEPQDKTAEKETPDDAGDKDKKEELSTKPAELEIKPLTVPRPESKKKADQPLDEIFEDADKPFVKQMSSQAREYLAAKFKRAKAREEELKAQVKGELPNSYYEHPEAYILDPTFKQAASAIQTVSNERNYWQEQFRKIKAGDKWVDAAIDSTGKIVYTERDPDANAEMLVQQRIIQANAIIGNAQGHIQNLQQNFGNKIQAAKQAISSVEDQFFPQFKDESARKANKYWSAIDKFMTDRYLNNTPISSMFAKLYAVAMGHNEYIDELKAQIRSLGGKIEGEDEEADDTSKEKKLGPSSASFAGGTDKKGKSKSNDPDDQPFDMNEFKKAKQGY